VYYVDYVYAYFIYVSLGYSGFDLDNIGKGKGGGACTAAAFLKVYDRILKKHHIL